MFIIRTTDMQSMRKSDIPRFPWRAKSVPCAPRENEKIIRTLIDGVPPPSAIIYNRCRMKGHNDELFFLRLHDRHIICQYVLDKMLAKTDLAPV